MKFTNGSMIAACPRTETSYRGARCHFALYEERGISDDELMRIEHTETPYILPPDQWFSDIDVAPSSFRDLHTDNEPFRHFQHCDYSSEAMLITLDRDAVDAMASIPDMLRSILSDGSDNGFRADTYVLDDFSGAAPIEFDSERFEEFIGEYKKRE